MEFDKLVSILRTKYTELEIVDDVTLLEIVQGRLLKKVNLPDLTPDEKREIDLLPIINNYLQ